MGPAFFPLGSRTSRQHQTGWRPRSHGGLADEMRFQPDYRLLSEIIRFFQDCGLSSRHNRRQFQSRDRQS
jgi:hypothetical protein